MDKKQPETRGGKRPGAGRKAGVTIKPATDTITVRLDAEKLDTLKKTYGKKLRSKLREVIEGMEANSS
jgi:hypothetical protein